ncbi:hypothetical protein HY408_01935 [Candidatus Gottesmanbacteria bacterium]|nr:hypothetical protein [Candidatus Gottesmanbacteria bacterium]
MENPDSTVDVAVPRLSESPQSQFEKRLLRLPLNYILPLVVIALSLYMSWYYVGTTWKTGTLSIVLVPFIGPFLAPFLIGEDNVLMTYLVLAGITLLPLSIYRYVFYETRGMVISFMTGILTLLPLIPLSSEVPNRFMLGLAEGDGAHMIGLSLIPFAAASFQEYLRTGIKGKHYLTILLSFSTVLISFFSFSVLLVFLFYMTTAEALVSEGRVKFVRFIKTAFILGFGTCLIYNISLIRILLSETGLGTIAVLQNFFPLTFFLVPVFGTFSFLIFDRRPNLQPIFISGSLALTFGILYFVGTSFVDTQVVNQTRYGVEFSFGQSFFISIIGAIIFNEIRIGHLLQRVPSLYSKRTAVAYVYLGICLVVLISSVLFIERGL